MVKPTHVDVARHLDQVRTDSMATLGDPGRRLGIALAKDLPLARCLIEASQGRLIVANHGPWPALEVVLLRLPGLQD